MERNGVRESLLDERAQGGDGGGRHSFLRMVEFARFEVRGERRYPNNYRKQEGCENDSGGYLGGE
jgi:hypothetical protein